MKVIKKILQFIFLPFSFYFSTRYLDELSKQSRRHNYIPIIVSVIVTILVVLVVYLNWY